VDHPFNHDLQAVLDADAAYAFLPEGSWLSGGCGLLAESLHRLISDSDIFVVQQLDHGFPDHVVVRVTCGLEIVYLDYSGVQTEDELIAAWRDECRGASIQLCSLADAHAAGINTGEVLCQGHLVSPFCRYLLGNLGRSMRSAAIPCGRTRRSFLGHPWVELGARAYDKVPVF